MRFSPRSASIIVVTAVLSACGRPHQPPARGGAETASFDKVKEKTKEAAQEMGRYARAQRDEFVSKISGRLEEMNREIDRLSARTADSADAAKTEAEPKIRALRDETARLRRELDRAKYATESAWTEIRPRLDQACNDLKDRLNNAREWASEKIAP